MNGILGTFDLTGGVTQSIYVGDTDDFTVASVNICNRQNVDVTISLAVTSSANSFESSRYIEYETVLPPKGVLERTGIVVDSSSYITVRSSYSNVNVVAYGIKSGDPITVSAIPVAADTTDPIISSTSFRFDQLDTVYEYQITTSNEVGAVTYTTSDALPAGFVLTTDGRIIGQLQAGSVSTSIDVVATDQSGNSSAATTIDLIIPDGSSSALAAPSAEFIKFTTQTNTNGTYWIDLPVSGATQTYCIMDSAFDGGGWMMAMKAASSGTTFNYEANYWTTNNTLNPSATDQSAGDAKFDVMNEFPALDIMARWPDIGTNGGSIPGTGTWTWMEKEFNNGERQELTSFFASPSNRTLATGGGGSGYFIRDAKTFSGWQSGVFSSQTDIRFYGFNYLGFNGAVGPAARWGFGWNENGEGLFPGATGAAPGSNDVYGGIGLGPTGNSWSAGDRIACCQDTTGINRQARVEIYVR